MLITLDQANIGFSLRMFSKVVPHPRYEGVMEVLAPLRPITYDVVSNPSHAKARVLQFTTESQTLKSLMSEETFLEESEEFFRNENIKNPRSSKELLTQYLNEIVSESFEELRNMKFRIG